MGRDGRRDEIRKTRLLDVGDVLGGDDDVVVGGSPCLLADGWDTLERNCMMVSLWTLRTGW